MMMTLTDLLQQKCAPAHAALNAEEVKTYLALLPDWRLDQRVIVRSFTFNNYYQTVAFVNAIAYVIHAEDHHPELLITYNHCEVRYNTHSVNGGMGGISDNDFICAAKVDAIFQQSFA